MGDEIKRSVVALRAAIDAVVQYAPTLKQKRDEFEAIEEIRLEQNSTAPIVDRHVFLQMVDDVAGTYSFMCPSMFLYPKVKEKRTRSIEYAFYS